MALAGDLLLRLGDILELTIWVPLEQYEAFRRIAAHGTIELVGPIIKGEFFPRIQLDLGKAVLNANFIVVTGPISGHAAVLAILAPHDLSKSTLIALPGGALALEAQRLLSRRLSPRVIVATNTLPYVCDRQQNVVTILVVKAQIAVAASKEIGARFTGAIAKFFPQRIEWYQDLASIFFSNIYPVIRPVGIIKAKEDIKSGKRPPPHFYKTLAADAIDQILAIDSERLGIAKALGIESDTNSGFLKKWFEEDAVDLKTFFQTYEGRAIIGPPNPIDLGYLEEDVKYNMALWIEIASVCGVEVPTMASTLDQASAAFDYDFRRNGTTLRSLGLADAEKEVIRDRLNGVVPKLNIQA
ncbi:NAD/NADP octopine/nopaline dehydrogenase family protein [Agrobacterium vitis]|uniref:NAD/NADP octopine/nopaline dehydrogenase family protein n=1 Tax=Agrobacterium vitis TaxID=373 RepID=UPI0018D24B89|nr:NAD/NADP octopine/nopaline dehydrogenase family protein [Agrobacterium vitis]